MNELSVGDEAIAEIIEERKNNLIARFSAARKEIIKVIREKGFYTFYFETTNTNRFELAQFEKDFVDSVAKSNPNLSFQVLELGGNPRMIIALK